MPPRYSRLPHRSIRLLQFLDDSGQKCRLVTHELAKAPPYLALTYTWAKYFEEVQQRSSDRRCYIRLDGKGAVVQENLHDALVHLCRIVRNSPASLLWVDSLCINQKDKEEVTRQVLIMKDIFEGSKGVIGWLGLPFDYDKISRGVSLMKRFAADFSSPNSVYSSLERLSKHSKLIPNGLQNATETLISGSLTGLQDLLLREYWNRTWIAQEITTPVPIVFNCGSIRFSIEELMASVMYLRLLSRFSGYSYLTTYCFRARNIYDYYFIEDQRSRNKNETLFSLLDTLRKTNCTDPRDKVFAALSLASAIESTQIQVDYEKSLADVYINVVQVALQTPAFELQFLSDVHDLWDDSTPQSYYSAGDSYIPSWVPDWRFTGSRIPLWLHSADYSPLFNPYPGSRMSATVHGHILKVKGVLLQSTRIEYRTPTLLDRCVNSIPLWYTIAQQWRPSILANETILRCLVADAKPTPYAKPKPDYITSVRRYERGFSVDGLGINSEWMIGLFANRKIDKFSEITSIEHAAELCDGRRMCLTTDGFLGIFPSAAQAGDLVAIFHGARVLYLVRPLADGVHFQFIGDCYVDGLMDGQAMADEFVPKPQPLIFKLV